MSLNIKNPETHALAAELARRLDVSMTEAVTLALADKLAATSREAEAARKLETLKRTAALITAMIGPEGLPDHGELLYDDLGMPK
jgi:antitoxin VapB